MTTSMNVRPYVEQNRDNWPKTGHHILANFNEKTIVVYQAFCPEIAEYAVKHGQFGGPKYSVTRMTWIKTNFLWMMYRAGWATKPNQTRILALHLTREGFDEILRSATEGKAIKDRQTKAIGPDDADDVRLQWDPDHSPCGGKVERRAIQLGLRGKISHRFNNEWITRIEDITLFVQTQHQFVINDQLQELLTPEEHCYVPKDPDICRHIRLEGFYTVRKRESKHDDIKEQSELDRGKTTIEGDTFKASEWACCSALLEEQLEFKINEVHTKEICITKHSDIKGNAQGLSSSSSGTLKNKKEDLILCLGGAFNPVHAMHVKAMTEAKAWLEANTNYRVVAGWFAVAPNGYVEQKCRRTNQKCIAGNHRIKLCEKASHEHEWLRPFGKTCGSADELGRNIRRKEKGNVDFAVIVGADRAMKMKWRKSNAPITVCIGREGTTDAVKTAFEEDKAVGLVVNQSFYIVPEELENVSSTGVRLKLAEMDKVKGSEEGAQKVVDEIVDLGWINKKQGQYIIDNESCMYLV